MKRTDDVLLVIDDACRAIDLNGSLAQAWQQMQAAGVARVTSDGVRASA